MGTSKLADATAIYELQEDSRKSMWRREDSRKSVWRRSFGVGVGIIVMFLATEARHYKMVEAVF